MLSPAGRDLAQADLKKTRAMLPLYDGKSLIVLEEAEEYLSGCLEPQLTKLNAIQARILALRKERKS